MRHERHFEPVVRGKCKDIDQNSGLALDFAATAYVLERGRITLSGPADEVAQSAVVQESYLGARRAGREA